MDLAALMPGTIGSARSTGARAAPRVPGMSFLDRFRRWSWPTREWVRDPRVPLVVDLDAFTLCGVELGAGFERLEPLGPADSPFFDWHGLGLSFDVDVDRLEAFTVALSPGAFPGAGWPREAPPFPGTIRIVGEAIGATRLAADRLVEAWGAPYWEDVDPGVEILLFFERHGVEVQLELAPDRRPRVLTVTADPLLADPEQREAYGILRPWPPLETGT